MELEYEITTEQANAAARVLRAAGIKTEKLAETLRQAAEVLAMAFGVVAEAFNILSDAWEQIEESGVLDIVEEPRAPPRKMNPARGRGVATKIPPGNKRVETERIYRRIYKPP